MNEEPMYKRIKERNCHYCKNPFMAHLKAGGYRWQDYCPDCAKEKVWLKGYPRRINL